MEGVSEETDQSGSLIAQKENFVNLKVHVGLEPPDDLAVYRRR